MVHSFENRVRGIPDELLKEIIDTCGTREMIARIAYAAGYEAKVKESGCGQDKERE